MQRSLSIAPKTLHKTLCKTRICIAVFLLLLAIVLYLFLHDIDSLYVFYPFRATQVYAFLKGCRFVMQGWMARLIVCHLIDALWFSSLLLLFSCVWTSHLIFKYVLAFCFALFTEILQLLIKNLGTFDVYDVLLYAIITCVFFIVEKGISKKQLPSGEHSGS